jgi:hypothetical protein
MPRTPMESSPTRSDLASNLLHRAAGADPIGLSRSLLERRAPRHHATLEIGGLGDGACFLGDNDRLARFDGYAAYRSGSTAGPLLRSLLVRMFRAYMCVAVSGGPLRNRSFDCGQPSENGKGSRARPIGPPALARAPRPSSAFGTISTCKR